MTKTQAIALEALCEKRLKEHLGEDCTVSLALTGRLRIDFNGHTLTFNKDLSPDYISFDGNFSDIDNYIEDIQDCIKKYKSDFDRLLWSYENVGNLTELQTLVEKALSQELEITKKAFMELCKDIQFADCIADWERLKDHSCANERYEEYIREATDE